MKFGVIGATLHGPYFYKGLELLEKSFGNKKGIATVFKKSIAGQLFVFPPFLLMFLGYKAFLDNKSPIEKIRNEFGTSYIKLI
jgi:protein Mpv17